MYSEDIYERLKIWNPWWSLNNVSESLIGIKRDLLDDVLQWIDEKEIKIIVGPRRAGKSTLFYQIINELSKRINLKNVLLINFQDPVLQKLDLDTLYHIFLKNNYPKGKVYVFLDEAQEKKGWDSWIKAKYDQKKDISFFVSGSNASLLKSDFAYYLSGRQITFELFPFNIKEFLRAKGFNKIIDIEDELKIQGVLKEYFLYGGFPEVVLKQMPNKQNLLLNYLNDFLEKDIIRRFDVNKNKLHFLYKWISTNAGKDISINKLSNILDISRETISNYIQYLKDSYLIIELKAFNTKLKLQEINPKRYYPIDLGFTNLYEFSFREESGKYLENAVAINLYFKQNNLYYLKDKDKDIDFVFFDNRSKKWTAIIVTHNPNLKREKESCDLAKKHKLDCIFLTYNVKDENAVPFYLYFYGYI